MKQLITLVLFLFLIPVLSSFSYTPKDTNQIKVKAAWKMKRFAKNAERDGDFYTAIDYYEAYCARKPKDLKTAYKLAELYRKTRDYNNAESAYLRVYETDKGKDFPLSLYWYASMLKINGKYKEAIPLYVKFSKEYRGQKDDKFWRNLSKAEVTGCELAQSYIDTVWNKAKNKVIISRMDTSINRPNIEFSPLPISENAFIYGSLRFDSVARYNPNDTAKKPVRKFYIAQKIKNDWKNTRSFQ